MARSIAQRRFSRSMIILMLSYIVILVGVTTFFRSPDRAGLMAYIAAVLPALPVVGVVFAMGRYLVQESDEYLRMKFNRQVLIATGVMLAVVTIWGFLERFGLVVHIDAYWAAVVWFLGFGIVGRIVNRLTFGEGAC
jgi:amino acid permease